MSSEVSVGASRPATPRPPAATRRSGCAGCECHRLREHGEVAYEYDFGDGWEHTVKLKGIETIDESFTRRLLDGARAFPPEDCGGIGCYEDAVSVAAGSEARYHDTDELREWLGDWDPEDFDLEAAREAFDG